MYIYNIYNNDNKSISYKSFQSTCTHVHYFV